MARLVRYVQWRGTHHSGRAAAGRAGGLWGAGTPGGPSGATPTWAWRMSLAEVGIVYGTAPWVWMTMLPDSQAAPPPARVSLVPLRDLLTILAEADPVTATAQIVGNLLVFAALGFLAPMRFAALASVPRMLALAAGWLGTDRDRAVRAAAGPGVLRERRTTQYRLRRAGRAGVAPLVARYGQSVVRPTSTGPGTGALSRPRRYAGQRLGWPGALPVLTQPTAPTARYATSLSPHPNACRRDNTTRQVIALPVRACVFPARLPAWTRLLPVVLGKAGPGHPVIGRIEYQPPVAEAAGTGRDVRGDGRGVAVAHGVPVGARRPSSCRGVPGLHMPAICRAA